MARVDDVARGDVGRYLFPRHAFEHFAKERCILPADAFPYYREQGHAAQTPWWRHGERQQRVAPDLVKAVLEEIREHGLVSARDLTDHGSVDPIDWSGWKGTAKATSMALEILWTQCDIVADGRTGAKIYDAPNEHCESSSRRVAESSSREMLVSTTRRPGDSKTAVARWALRERACARSAHPRRADRCGRCSAVCARHRSSMKWSKRVSLST
jgi:uncharacterized protein YcaQ